MSIPSSPPISDRALFAAENERLLVLLRSLSASDWHRSTPCPGWDVHALATHLLGGSFGVISWLRDDFRGTPPPHGLDEEGFISWLDNLQSEWVQSARRISPALVIELLDWSATRFQDALDRDDPTEIKAIVSWASPESVPMWLDHARELSEKWIHRQQILQALDQPADLRADVAHPILDALRWAYPNRLSQIHRPANSTVEIHIHDTEPDRRWTLVSDGQHWDFHDDLGLAKTEHPRDATLLASMWMSVDQAWRLLTNNYDELANLNVRASGDPEIVNTLMSTRAIIGRPK